MEENIVKRVISPYTIQLEILLKFQVHPIFYITFLELATNDLFYLGYVQLLASFIEVDKKIKYEFSAIVHFRLFRKAKRLQYPV